MSPHGRTFVVLAWIFADDIRYHSDRFKLSGCEEEASGEHHEGLLRSSGGHLARPYPGKHPDVYETMSSAGEAAERYLQLLGYTQLYQNKSDFPPGGLFTPELLDPNYKAPSRATTIIGISSAMVPVAVGVVLLRLWAIRNTPGMKLGSEDYAIIPAMVLFIAQSAVQIVSTKACMGLHGYDCKVQDYAKLYRLYQPTLQLYFYTMFFIKLSNLFFVYRITPDHLRRTRWATIGFFVLHIAWTLTASIVNLFACSPVAANWEFEARYLRSNKCVDMEALAIATNTIYAASDFAFLALPVYVVWNMQLPPRTKAGIAFLFSLGLLAAGASTIKVFYWAKYYRLWDPLWYAVDTLKWAIIECGIALIIVSLPTVDTVLVKLVPQRWRDGLRKRDEQLQEHTPTSTDRCMSLTKMDFARQLDPRLRTEDLLSSGHSREAWEKRSVSYYTSTELPDLHKQG